MSKWSVSSLLTAAILALPTIAMAAPPKMSGEYAYQNLEFCPLLGGGAGEVVAHTGIAKIISDTAFYVDETMVYNWPGTPPFKQGLKSSLAYRIRNQNVMFLGGFLGRAAFGDVAGGVAKQVYVLVVNKQSNCTEQWSFTRHEHS
jgi:hypothetical protein